MNFLFNKALNCRLE